MDEMMEFIVFEPVIEDPAKKGNEQVGNRPTSETTPA